MGFLKQFSTNSRQRLLFAGLLVLLMMVAPAAGAADSSAPVVAAEGGSGISGVVALFLGIGIILVAARIAGSTARALGQPRVLGELLIGVVLGPSVLNMLQWGVFGGHDLSNVIHELAEIGVLLLMFNIGLDVHIKELAKVGKVALFAGFLGVIFPVVFSGLITFWGGYEWQTALFAGVVLAATSVSISAQVLLEVGHLHSRVGNGLLATALIDDVLTIILVSLTVAITGASGGAVDIAQLGGIVLRMSLYIAVAFAVSWWIVPQVFEWLAKRPNIAQNYGMAVWGVALAFIFGWSAEAIGGVAAITGAFIAGVGLSRLNNQEMKREIGNAVSYISYAFVVPIFFINVGLQIDLSNFPWGDAWLFALVMLVVAILTKVIGAGIGGRLGGFNNREALQLGVCMVSRGEVGLIVAAIGVNNGILVPTDPLFSVLFLTILLTTVLTPPIVRVVFAQRKSVEKPATTTA